MASTKKKLEENCRKLSVSCLDPIPLLPPLTSLVSSLLYITQAQQNQSDDIHAEQVLQINSKGFL